MLKFHVCKVKHLPLIVQDNKFICDAQFDWSPLATVALFVDIVIMLKNEAFLLLFLDTTSDQKLDGGKSWDYVLLCPVGELVLVVSCG